MKAKPGIPRAAASVAIAAAILALPVAAAPEPAVTTPGAAQPASSPASAALDRHLAAFAKHDVDAIMADYSDQAVFITPDGVLNGKTQIRSLFEGLVAEFSSPEASVTIHQRYAAGPIAYITWSAQTPKNRYEFATDTLYVEGGLIHYQTFAAVIVPR